MHSSATSSAIPHSGCYQRRSKSQSRWPSTLTIGEFLSSGKLFAWPSISRIDFGLLELRTDTTISALEELVQAGHIPILESGQFRLLSTAQKPPVKSPRNSKPVQRDILRHTATVEHIEAQVCFKRSDRSQPMQRPTRESIRQEQQRASKTGLVIGFPHVKFITAADLDLQKQAENLFRELNGQCPCCRANKSDRHGKDGAIFHLAQHGRLTFECRVCPRGTRRHRGATARDLDRRP